MSDDALDRRLARELRAYSDGGVRPIDPMAMAQIALGPGSRRRLVSEVALSVRSRLSTGQPRPVDSSLEDAVVPLGRRPPSPAWKAADDNAARLAIMAAAVVVIVVAGMNLLPSLTAPSPAATARPGVPTTPARVNPEPANLTHAIIIEGLRFSFRAPSAGWETFGSLLASKSVAGPQGAEAMVFWAGFPDGSDADPCINAPIARWTAADVAAYVAAAPGTELLTGPTDVTVGGYPAKHVVVVVREDTGCDPGFFYNWRGQTGGALWVTTELGDTIRVWVVDVNGSILFIAGETHRDLRPGVALTDGGRARLEQEIQQIVDSIQFD